MLLAYFFANVEIQIEGSAGWAANLPTWRIEHHWLLDLFWGGRPMTGYHAWVFPFVALFFHLPAVFNGRWSWRIEARTIACIMVFWLTEDFLWFVLNPAYGLPLQSGECAVAYPLAGRGPDRLLDDERRRDRAVHAFPRAQARLLLISDPT